MLSRFFNIKFFFIALQYVWKVSEIRETQVLILHPLSGIFSFKYVPIIAWSCFSDNAWMQIIFLVFFILTNPMSTSDNARQELSFS